MDYKEALDYLFTQLPMYQRIGPAAYKSDLSNTIKILDYLENPQTGFKSVHIAGTNGKGSTSHMIASILQEAGYKTGLYTSPHLKDYRERIRINGKMIDQDLVTEFVSTHHSKFTEIEPSFFEITVGMAFWYFKKMKVDIAIIETGLGGRLDSTNLINPEISVITNIGMDHTQFLGETIEKIAAEKGGIIKENTPLVLGEMKPEAERILLEMAESKNAKVLYAKNMQGDLPDSDLRGEYQTENIKTALTTIKGLMELGWNIELEHVLRGISNVQENTGLKGRWQIMGERPLIIADCAHNPDGINQVVKNLNNLEFDELHIILAVVNDKKLDEVLSLLPKDANYYFSEAKIARALPAEELKEFALKYDLKGDAYSSISRSYEAARLYANQNDVILVTGSIFTVAEVV